MNAEEEEEEETHYRQQQRKSLEFSTKVILIFNSMFSCWVVMSRRDWSQAIAHLVFNFFSRVSNILSLLVYSLNMKREWGLTRRVSVASSRWSNNHIVHALEFPQSIIEHNLIWKGKYHDGNSVLTSEYWLFAIYPESLVVELVRCMVNSAAVI